MKQEYENDRLTCESTNLYDRAGIDRRVGVLRRGRDTDTRTVQSDYESCSCCYMLLDRHTTLITNCWGSYTGTASGGGVG